jgi:Na+-transporting NADH:ubiquinone oxidoreductase subunit NqrC
MRSIKRIFLASGEEGASLAEVVVAMLLMSVVGVSLASVLVGARPVTDNLKAKAQKQVVLDKDIANIRVADFVPCTLSNLQVPGLYKGASNDKQISVSTEVYLSNSDTTAEGTWVPCNASIFSDTSANGVAIANEVSTAALQRVTVKLTRVKGPPVIHTLVKVMS